MKFTESLKIDAGEKITVVKNEVAFSMFQSINWDWLHIWGSDGIIEEGEFDLDE